jgi:rhamnose transport system ATP-binding protein
MSAGNLTAGDPAFVDSRCRFSVERRRGESAVLTPLLAVAGLSVRYGATTALDAVDFDVRPGEVHALVGENGAGKSTLLRILAGAEAPHAGSVARSPGARVAWVPQEAMLPADLDAAAWIFLGEELCRPLGLLRARAMRAAAADALAAVGCHASPDARLGDLTASQRKQVQLARALRGSLDVLLVDEPTAVLGAAEAERLFAAVRGLARRGAAVVYVSHRLDEVLGLADRVTVLRDGRRVATHAVRDIGEDDLVRAMVGRNVPRAGRAGMRRDTACRVRAANAGARVLELRDVAFGHVRGVSLALQVGEIVGLAGLVGSGRSALLEGVAGLRPLRAGTMRAAAPPVFVPEDRQRKGLVGPLCLRENLFLPADSWRLRLGVERLRTVEWIERLAIRASGSEAAIDSLSGGNQQKLLLARALRHRPRLLLLDEPTAGVDVGAKAEIHAAVRQLADAGTAILLASSDLPELLALCDRIVALYRGRCAGVVDLPQASEEQVAALMTGAGSPELPPRS